MGKRKGIGIDLDIDSNTLSIVNRLWECFSKATDLEINQIEGIVYGISNGNKLRYLLAERRASNKDGLSIDNVSKILPIINTELGLDAGYCIVHIPENGWTRRKIDMLNDKYIEGLTCGSVSFRVERFNSEDNTIVIKSTSYKNR